jgi:hypothetical protein
MNLIRIDDLNLKKVEKNIPVFFVGISKDTAKKGAESESVILCTDPRISGSVSKCHPYPELWLSLGICT